MIQMPRGRAAAKAGGCNCTRQKALGRQQAEIDLVARMVKILIRMNNTNMLYTI